MVDAEVVVSGVVGLLGVGVGLTGDIVRRRWQRPNLELRPYDPESGDLVIFDVFKIPEKAAFLRLRVFNVGRETARNVEICVEAVESLDQHPDPDRRQHFQRHMGGLIGRQLKWADRDSPFLDIPPSTMRRIDIVNVYGSESALTTDDGKKMTPIRVTLNKRSGVYRDLLPDREYRLTLSISADNAQARVFSIKMAFDGTWAGDDAASPSRTGALVITDVSVIQ
jgi:hypothetical protein